MIPFITDSDVARVLDFPSVAAAIDRAFTSFAAGRAAIAPRQRLASADVGMASMGAIWADAGVSAYKVYSTVAGRFNFLVTLFDTATGAPLAILQGNELTRFRTPALTSLMVGKAALRMRKLALFGAGVQGRAHADALVQSARFERIDVVDVADVSDWCRQLGERARVAVRQVSAADAVREADVVVTATRSKQPLFDGALLKPGALVVAVGTSGPQGSELDATALHRAARVVVEWRPQSDVEAGELVFGRRAGVLSDDRVWDLHDVYSGRVAVRESDDDIVVFKSVGVGLTDLAAASVAWARLSPTLR